MTRPAGVTASAVVGIIGSVLTLLLAGLFVYAANTPESAQIPNYRTVTVVVAMVIAAHAVFGILNAVALLKLKRWARTATLVFAGIMATMSLMLGLVSMVIPLPPMPGSTPGMIATIRGVIVGIYAIPLAIGVWWLVQFNTRKTKDAFASGDATSGPPARPLMISIIGWWNLLGGVLCLIPFALRLPAFVAGVILTGWSAALVYLVMGAISAFIGWELLKLRERGRLLTIAWFALTMAHTAYMTLSPQARQRMMEFQNSAAFGPVPETPGFDPTAFTNGILVFVVVLFAAAIVYLVRAKPAFEPKAISVTARGEPEP
jgi:hypothetical protein